MKTKRFLMKSAVALAFFAFVITGCKKENAVTPDNTEETTASSAKTNASDQTNVDQQTNESIDDVNKVLNDNPNTRTELLCNVTIDSTALMTQGLIKLTYHGLSCDLLRNRTGVISIQLPYDKSINKPVRWTAKGASVIITYDNYKVTRVADNKSVTFNGKLTATNVTGGGALNVILLQQTVTHDLRGGLTITFDDGTTREWAVARTRSYKPSLTTIVCEDSGDTVINGKKVSYWGKNRANEEFSVAITQPIATEIYTLNLCRLYRPYQGVVELNTTAAAATVKSATITYGVDANGTQVTGTACPYGYKLNWTDANGAQQLIVRY